MARPHFVRPCDVILSEECSFVPRAKGGEFGYNYLMYDVYILRLKNNTFYTGFSSSLKEKIKAHQTGSISQTKNLRPVKLVFYSAFSSKKKAFEFEKYLKTGSGAAFRNKRFVEK